ncbi:unnamed protein product [Clavelina lepadiformis]|uniref:ATP-binding cassette sub-family B member 6 n=1 Tax=Clavelina lepadiformis TaxID=159417 RepID=A0ABP0GUZ1_CLALP
MVHQFLKPFNDSLIETSLTPQSSNSSNHSTNHSNFGFCAGYGGYRPMWRKNGISHCFFDTWESVFFFLLSGALLYEIMIIKRVNNHRNDDIERRRSVGYVLQLLCMALLLAESIAQFVVKWTLPEFTTNGVSILSLTSKLLSVSLIISLLVFQEKIQQREIRHENFVLLFTWLVFLSADILSAVSWNSPEWWFSMDKVGNQVLFALWIVRIVFTALPLLIGILKTKLGNWNQLTEENNFENENLNTENNLEQETEVNLSTESTWIKIWRKSALIWPFIWPEKNFLLQLRVIFCILCLIGGRVINPFVPIFYKKIVNSLTNDVSWTIVWVQVVQYVLLKSLQGTGSGGIIDSIRLYSWIKVQQYTNRCVQIRLFQHLHSLSLRWHLSRKTGAVLRSIDRGTLSINSFVSYIVFSIFPTILDIIVAVVFFITTFNIWFGLIVFVSLTIYLVATILITEMRTKIRRQMNFRDNKSKQTAIDSLLNFETVKYYNAEDYEAKRFDKAILQYQHFEYRNSAALVLLGLTQLVIINIGLLAGSLLCAYYVTNGEMQVGDFVLFGTYIIQLNTPLAAFGTYYTTMQINLIDMENMFELFDETPDIYDKNDATQVFIDAGNVEFDNVCFGYSDEKETLKNISFKVGPGETYALVGPSGSGKSTIIRLLFRFYDIQSGSITLDGLNITDMTQECLRRHIGVVPQDTVLFNDNIRNNIRYGRVTATDEEVNEAAESADIHHRILSMPDQYDTHVGERGLKLSGGEKQRVAIARTILKAPNVVLLDEATSALDTNTERNIQASLARVCAGRTSIVVAHRLSTIVSADCILVLKDGEIVERGRHEDLMSEEGVYATMWMDQLQKSPQGGSPEGTSKDI